MRIVFVDDALTVGNPSSQSLALSLEKLIACGIEIEFWGGALSSNHRKQVKQRLIPTVKIPFVGSIFNWVIRNFIGGLYWLSDSRKVETVYVSTGGHFLFCNVAWFHFYNRAWNDIQNKGIERGPESRFRQLFVQWGRFEDWLVLNSPFLQLVLVVSDAVRDEIKKDHPTRVVRTLANAVDFAKFDIKRSTEKDALRAKFGFGDEIVLLFISQGHYTRKGFWLAVKALHSFRQKYPSHKIRFVVLGGRKNKLDWIRNYLDSEYSGWNEWIVMAGWTNKVEDYLIASDVLFYPSYFEAFSLVEIEAAATGLPMILTSHHGSEMILEDGVNGYFCDSTEESISKTLLYFCEKPLKITAPTTGRALTIDKWTSDFILNCKETLSKEK